MDAANCALACGLVSKSYVAQGQQALAQRQRRVKALLSSRRLPEEGWDDATIEAFLQVGALTVVGWFKAGCSSWVTALVSLRT